MALLGQIRRARQSKDTLHYVELHIRAGSSSSNFKIDRSIPGAQVPDELLKHSGALPVGAPIIRVRPTGGPARLHRMCIRTMAMLMYFRFADGIDCPLGEVVTVSQFKQQGAVL